MPETAALDPGIAAILKRPFAEQVAFFRGKLGKLVPTAKWDDLWQSAHDSAFMVAGAARADLLADLAGAVDKAISDGETLDAFRKRFAAIVQQRGWHGWTGEGTAAGRDWRTRIIYQTNLSTSYAAGRLTQLREAGFKLWIYKHSDAVAHPRPQHLAWNGLTLPADHAFWKTHFAPNGWGCRCRIVGASGSATAKLMGGKPGYTEPPEGWNAIDPKTGAPMGIDKGFGYQPGNTVSDAVRAMARKTVAWPYELAKAYMTDVPAANRDALAQAIRSQPETGQVVRRYAERVLGARNGAPIEGPVDVPPYQTMGLLTSAQAAETATLTGIDAVRMQLYDWAIDASTVRKVAKDHGDDTAEARSGQTGVRAQDYALLPRIIQEADRLEYGGLSDVGRPVVRAIRQIGDLEYWAVFEVRERRRMLALQSMWIRGRPSVLRP